MTTVAPSRSLLVPGLAGWHMAGAGGFRAAEAAVESFGGPGLLWYADEVFTDFVLALEWRTTTAEDNSGVFIRCPALRDGDIRPAIAEGYEVQIDERGLDPESGQSDSPLHLTGAIYRLAPAAARASWPMGAWNLFEITAQGGDLSVALNGVEVSRLTGGTRRRSGHLALQAHHDGSAVQFRRVEIAPLI
jgi:hypothetical protein